MHLDEIAPDKEPHQDEIKVEIILLGFCSIKDENIPLNVKIFNKTDDDIFVDRDALIGLYVSGDDNAFNVSSRFEYVPSKPVCVSGGSNLEFFKNIYDYISQKEKLVPGKYSIILRYEIGETIYPSNEIHIDIKE